MYRIALENLGCHDKQARKKESPFGTDSTVAMTGFFTKKWTKPFKPRRRAYLFEKSLISKASI